MNNACTLLIKETDINHELDVFDARRGVFEAATQFGFNRSQSHFLVTALTELANNIVFHSVGGWISVRQIESVSSAQNGKDIGIQLIASDRGPGIVDVAMALQDGFSTGNSLGCGLSGVNRLMDELDIASSSDGTVVTAIMWLRGSR